jgi:hypothetical protein
MISPQSRRRRNPVGSLVGAFLTKFVPTTYVMVGSGAIALVLLIYGVGKMRGRDEERENKEQ